MSDESLGNFKPEETIEDKPAPIQFDIYGVKFAAKPKPTSDAGDKLTVHLVLRDAWQSLLRVCKDSLGLVADIFSGARSLVRGLADLPDAINTRIRGAHKLAEETENRAQTKPVNITFQAQTLAAARIQHLLLEYQKKGLSVGLRKELDGRLAIYAVRPGAEELLKLPPVQHDESILIDRLVALGIIDDELLKFLEGRGIRRLADLRSAFAKVDGLGPVPNEFVGTLDVLMNHYQKPPLDWPIENLRLPESITHALAPFGFKTVAELITSSVVTVGERVAILSTARLATEMTIVDYQRLQLDVACLGYRLVETRHSDRSDPADP